MVRITIAKQMHLHRETVQGVLANTGGRDMIRQRSPQ